MAISTSPRSQEHIRSPRGAHVAPRSLYAMAMNSPLADYYLVLVPVVLLIGFGVTMVLSSSSVLAYLRYDDSYYFVKRQAVFLVVGLPIAWWLSRRSVSFLKSIAWLAWGLAMTLLMLTFVPGFGIEVMGNRNWIQLGTDLIRIQPSEFAKIAIVVWGASVLANKGKSLDRPKELVWPFVPLSFLLVGLVLAEQDLGTALIMSAIIFSILFFVGAPFRLLGSLLLIGLAGVAALVIASPNRMTRVMIHLDPTRAGKSGIDRQAQQSLYGLASGGWWGQGLGASREKYGALSEAHTDFVFSIIGEELGFLGTIAVVLLFGTLAYAGVRIAARNTDAFTRITAAGITAWFTIQSFANIAVVLGLVPVIGIPLPFISYGGSSLMANILAAGVLMACARNEPAAAKVLAKGKSRSQIPHIAAVVDSGRR